MRIGFDARYINDRYHGIGRYSFRLLESLVQQCREHTFIVFRGQETDSRFDWTDLISHSRVEIYAGPWPLYWPQEQLVWPSLLKKHKVDLFHSPYIVAPLWKSPFRESLPVIITIHDLIFDRYPGYMPASWLRLYYKSMMWLSIKRSEMVVTVSNHTTSDLIRFYNPPRNKIYIIPEGVDPGFQPKMAGTIDIQIRNRYDLQQPYILTVGARRPHKNLGILVDAFANLAAHIPHILVFAGPPDDRFEDEARIAAQNHQLNGRVRFLDWVPEDDLPGIYQLADLVVLPSYIEGFGLPALEAMASGTPLAAAINSSFPEIAGEAALYFNPQNIEQITHTMRIILLDPKIQVHMHEAGIQRAAGFTWESAAGIVLHHYDRLRR